MRVGKVEQSFPKVAPTSEAAVRPGVGVGYVLVGGGSSGRERPGLRGRQGWSGPLGAGRPSGFSPGGNWKLNVMWPVGPLGEA